MSNHESIEKELEKAEAELSEQELEQVNGGYIVYNPGLITPVRLTTWSLPIVWGVPSNKEWQE
jgi:hypothetical protein